MKATRQLILDKVSDLAGRFLYYDRKEDTGLPVGAIEDAIGSGEITANDIIEAFATVLREECEVP